MRHVAAEILLYIPTADTLTNEKRGTTTDGLSRRTSLILRIVYDDGYHTVLVIFGGYDMCNQEKKKEETVLWNYILRI